MVMFLPENPVCAVCKHSGNDRVYMRVTRELEFTRRSHRDEEIVVCGVCYKAIRTYKFMQEHWRAEEQSIAA